MAECAQAILIQVVRLRDVLEAHLVQPETDQMREHARMCARPPRRGLPLLPQFSERGLPVIEIVDEWVRADFVSARGERLEVPMAEKRPAARQIKLIKELIESGRAHPVGIERQAYHPARYPRFTSAKAT